MAIKTSGILLNNQYNNLMRIGGETGWFIRDYNPSIGYDWRFRQDNSGVYTLDEEIVLHASTNAVGVPGMRIWKFKPLKKGFGYAIFELYPPGSPSPVETVVVGMTVV